MNCLVEIADLLSFVFPPNVQHPLAAGRLYCYSLYGPADDKNKLRSGYKRSHVLVEYELETMCHQFEKEDTISVFTTRFEELSNAEQSMIICQSDLRFKTSKGRAVFPSLTLDDVMSILKPITRDPDGRVSFHSLQDAINVYRSCRIQSLRLSYPPLQPKKRSTHMNATMWLETTTNTHLDVSSSLKQNLLNSDLTVVDCNDRLLQSNLKKKVHGLSKAEIFEKASKNLSRNSFKVSTIGDRDRNRNTIPNVQLLRESQPLRRFQKPDS